MHYNDVIMSAMASQIISPTSVYSTVYSGADQRKHQSSASLAFVRGIHRWPVNSPYKRPVTRKMLPFDDVIMGTGATTKRNRAMDTENRELWHQLCGHCWHRRNQLWQSLVSPVTTMIVAWRVLMVFVNASSESLLTKHVWPSPYILRSFSYPD